MDENGSGTASSFTQMSVDGKECSEDPCTFSSSGRADGDELSSENVDHSYSSISDDIVIEYLERRRNSIDILFDKVSPLPTRSAHIALKGQRKEPIDQLLEETTDREERIIYSQFDDLLCFSDSNPLALLIQNEISEQGIHFEREHLKLFQLTWNMMGQLPRDTQQLSTFIPPNKHHIYCITTQECEKTIEKCVINSNKQRWESIVSDLMGPDYIMIQSCTLVALHMCIFIHHKLVPMISDIRSSLIPCGVEILTKDLGNKGGVFIAFQLNQTRLLFIGSHLPASQDKVLKRNKAFHRIMAELETQLQSGMFDSHHQSQPSISRSDAHAHRDIFTYFDYIIWSGDLNYRINGNRAVVDKLLAMNMSDVLLANDQLTIERKQQNVFENFMEGSITFPPTYKFNVGSDRYDSGKKRRIPAWTDRILYYYRNSKNRKLLLVSYDAVMNIRLSDHRPVVGTFLAEIDLQNRISNRANQPPDEQVLTLLKRFDSKKQQTGSKSIQSSVCLVQ